MKKPAKPFSEGLTKISKRLLPGNMPEEIRLFEIAREGAPPKEQPAEPTPAPSSGSKVHGVFGTPSDGSGSGDLQQEYWHKKLQELTLENIKLQEKLKEVTRSRDQFVNEQLEPAQAAAQAAEAAYQAEAAKTKQLEEELSTVRQTNDKLGSRLIEEQGDAVRARQYQEELLQLRQACDESNARLAEERRDALESSRRAELLEQQLSKSTGEVSRLKAELQQRVSQAGSLKNELSVELAEAQVAAEKAQAACKEEAARSTRLETELDRLRLMRVEFTGKLAEETQAAAQSRKHAEELQRRLSEMAIELERAKAELNHHTVGRATLETQLREQLESAKAASDRAQAAYREQLTAASTAREELMVLRRARDDFSARLASEQQASAELRRKNDEMQNRLREAVTELARAKAELESRVSEQGSVHSDLARQLEAAKSAADKAQVAYKKKLAQGSKVEDELASLKKARTQLANKMKTERKETAQAKRRVKELEDRLARASSDLERAKAGLASSTARGGRGSSSGSAEPSQMDVRVRDSISALARATADLEKERRRLESTALHSRYSSLDASRLGRAFVNSFRTQLRMPSENLMDSIRRLLELQLDSEQRKLVESALQSALLLQAAVQEEPMPDDGQRAGEDPREAA